MGAGRLHAAPGAGSMDGVGHGNAIDSMANVVITGNTDSADFPVTTGAYQTTYSGGSGNCPVDAFTCGDAFVFSLNAADSRLNYSTYLGGLGFGGHTPWDHALLYQ